LYGQLVICIPRMIPRTVLGIVLQYSFKSYKRNEGAVYCKTFFLMVELVRARQNCAEAGSASG